MNKKKKKITEYEIKSRASSDLFKIDEEEGEEEEEENEKEETKNDDKWIWKLKNVEEQTYWKKTILNNFNLPSWNILKWVVRILYLEGTTK